MVPQPLLSMELPVCMKLSDRLFGRICSRSIYCSVMYVQFKNSLTCKYKYVLLIIKKKYTVNLFSQVNHSIIDMCGPKYVYLFTNNFFCDIRNVLYKLYYYLCNDMFVHLLNMHLFVFTERFCNKIIIIQSCVIFQVLIFSLLLVSYTIHFTHAFNVC